MPSIQFTAGHDSLAICIGIGGARQALLLPAADNPCIGLIVRQRMMAGGYGSLSLSTQAQGGSSGSDTAAPADYASPISQRPAQQSSYKAPPGVYMRARRRHVSAQTDSATSTSYASWRTVRGYLEESSLIEQAEANEQDEDAESSRYSLNNASSLVGPSGETSQGWITPADGSDSDRPYRDGGSASATQSPSRRQTAPGNISNQRSPRKTVLRHISQQSPLRTAHHPANRESRSSLPWTINVHARREAQQEGRQPRNGHDPSDSLRIPEATSPFCESFDDFTSSTPLPSPHILSSSPPALADEALRVSKGNISHGGSFCPDTESDAAVRQSTAKRGVFGSDTVHCNKPQVSQVEDNTAISSQQRQCWLESCRKSTSPNISTRR